MYFSKLKKLNIDYGHDRMSNMFIEWTLTILPT
jgi:hypothetical protein